MWPLSQDQAARLTALVRQRDLQRLGGALAEAFPQARDRLADRWGEFVALGVQRGTACGLSHLLCLARYLATWVACGAEFESRQEWAAAILTDDKRSQGAKAYQICVRVLEQLRSAPQPGQPAAAEFGAGLQLLDRRLAASGTLGSLLTRDRIRLGSACDLDAVELRLVDATWRQHYTAIGGPWRREASVPPDTAVTLVHNPLGDAALQLPAQITMLSRPAYGDAAAKLRVRLKAEHRCDAQVHPLLQCAGPTGARVLRGDLAGNATFSVHAEIPEDGKPPHIGEEGSPQFSVLTIAACGLRERGLPIGELKTLLAAYDATQHLIAWRHEAMPAWQMPIESPPPIAPVRCRREADGIEVDSSAWQRGFQELDLKLQQGLARLFTGWERESGVSDGKLTIEAALLAGSAGITWGWAEHPRGIAMPPYMRLEALFDLVACRLALRFTGTLNKAGSRSQLTLATDGQAALSGPWQRRADDGALFAAAAPLKVAIRQPFTLDVLPLADTGLAVLGAQGAVRGVVHGAVGLEQRPDGPGLRWFVRLNVEPVVATLRLVDPLLGVQVLQQALLPAQPLVDWSQA